MKKKLEQTMAKRPDAGAAGWQPHPALICVLLAAVTFAVYWPAQNWDFINFDDPSYVASNPDVQAGLNWQNVVWAFSGGRASNWHPVTWLSHMIDCEIFGAWAGGHHLANVLWHIAGSVLLFLLLRQMTGLLWRGALVAALFALHPVHVESVAWISERKDVLSAFFGFLTLIFYARYAERRTMSDGRRAAGAYALTLIFFALGLMSKPMLVTWPFVMLLLDWWPLNRIHGSGFGIRSWGKLLVEKIPFFAMSAASCVVTFMVQNSSGAVRSLTQYSVEVRLENVFISYLRYMGKTFWPVKLAILYPYPRNYWPWLVIGACVAVLLAVSALSLWLARRRPFFFVGWFWFLGTLIPVIGLVQVGGQSMADRYNYLPSVGLFVALVWGLAGTKFWQKLPRVACAAVVAALLTVCALRTADQLNHWRNSETLFRHAIAVTENNSLAFHNLGVYLGENGREVEAMGYFRKALSLMQHKQITSALENALKRIEQRRTNSPAVFAAVSNRDLAGGHQELASAYVREQKFDDAFRHFELALQFEPTSALTHYNYGLACTAAGKTEEAIREYELAIMYDPNHAEAHNNLGVVLSLKEKFGEALPHFAEAVRAKQDYAEAHNNFAYALLRLGRRDEAVGHLHEALRLKPDYEQALRQLHELGVEP